MLAYFPEIMPDETLYSVAARFHRHVAAQHASGTLLQLFDRPTMAASLDLPNSLTALAERIPSGRGLNVDRLIDETTLFPYYAAYRNELVRAAARAGMSGSHAPVHFILGIQRFAVRRVDTLRFCPDCVAAMVRERGEAWWRRVHQLPGVCVCPTHGAVLRLSKVRSGMLGRGVFVPASTASCPSDAPSMVDGSLDHRALRLLEDVAVASDGLLRLSGASGWPQPDRLARQGRLMDAGLASKGQVLQERLHAAFADFLGGASVAFPDLLEHGRPGQWLTSIVRPHRKSFHPLQHILLNMFIERLQPAPPAFGRGPWRCENPVAQHFGRDAVTRLDVRHAKGMTVGTFSCSCGYVYTRRVGAQRTPEPPRYRRFGPLVIQALSRARTEGLSLQETARRLGIATGTVAKLLAAPGSQLGTVPSPRRQPPRRRPRPGRRRDPRRSAGWQVAARRRRNQADAALVPCLRSAAAVILAEDPPVRVTMAELDRRVGKHGYLGKRRTTLPEAYAEAKRLSETIQAFRLRCRR